MPSRTRSSRGSNSSRGSSLGSNSSRGSNKTKKNKVCAMVSNFVNNIISKKSSSSLQKNIQHFQIKWNDIIPPELHSRLEKNRKKLDKLDTILINIQKNFTKKEYPQRQRQAIIIYIYGRSEQRKKLDNLTKVRQTQLNSMKLDNLSDDIIRNSARNLKPCESLLSNAPTAGGGGCKSTKKRRRKSRSK